MTSNPITALVMTGGGARGAYQAGVCRALAKIAEKHASGNPFGIFTGTSAGAINATFLAATSDDFKRGANQLANFWVALQTDQVFRTDVASLGRIGLRWVWEALSGGRKRTSSLKGLLDTSPLRLLLSSRIPFERIAGNIEAGYLRALSITATEYNSSDSITFFQGNQDVNAWQHMRRSGRRTQISTDHVLASSALPLLFPPVGVGNLFYGDGCLRNTAPLSPALRLGAERLMIIGVRKPRDDSKGSSHELTSAEIQPNAMPSVGRVLSVLLNAVLLDAVEVDIDRLVRLNHTVRKLPEHTRNLISYREVQHLYLQPSEDIGVFAASQFDKLPKTLRHLIGGLGSQQEASELVSYLLFEPHFCGYLVNLGYQDTVTRRDEIEAFMFSTPHDMAVKPRDELNP